MIGILILTISILLQFVAAVLAVRLIRITGKHLAWSMIATAVVLMAVRRSISLFQYFGPEPSKPPDVLAESVALITSACMLIGIARISPLFLEQKQAEEALREQERNTQSLLRLSRKLERTQTYSEALNAAREEVKTIIGYSDLWAYIFTEDKKYAHMLVAKGPIVEKLFSDKDEVMTLTIKGDRMLEEIVEAKDIVVIENAHTDERTDKKIVERLGICSLINVPIFLIDRHLGSMGMCTFDDEGVRIPNKSERTYLITVASQLAVTLDRLHLLTQRKQAEDSLRKSEEKFRTLFEESFDGLMITSPEGKILDMNKKGLMMFGYDKKEDFKSLDLEQDIYAYSTDRKHILEITNAQGTAEYEVVFKKKSGETMICHCSLTAVKDESGVISSYRAIIRDITEQKRAEEALQESREIYRRIVDTTNEGIWAIDSAGITNFINLRMAQMLGYEREEMIGKKIYSFVFEEDVSDQIKKIETRRQGIAEQYERRWRNKNGHAVWTIVSATPMFHPENDFAGSFAMITDITKRKKAEEELKEHREHLEELVSERTSELEKKNVELERFNKLFVGRELRMVELKKTIAGNEKKISELEKEIVDLKKSRTVRQ